MTDPVDSPAQAAALKAARKAARMSQEHLAAAAGISSRTVRRAENGWPVSPEVALALRAVLGPVELAAPPAAPTPAPATVEGIPPDPVAERIARRPMPVYEVALRLTFRDVTRWVGGIHPVLLLALLGCFTRSNFENYPLGIALAVSIPAACYVSSRGLGATPRQALAFIRGHAFADGEPLDLRARQQAHAAAAGRRHAEALARAGDASGAIAS